MNAEQPINLQLFNNLCILNLGKTQQALIFASHECCLPNIFVLKSNAVDIGMGKPERVQDKKQGINLTQI